MALIQCHECENPVSTEAAACPHCGAPPQPKQSQRLQIPPPLPSARGPSEETIHSDQNVIVTTTRVMIWGTTYALRNITSVKMGRTPPATGAPTFMLALGLIILGFSIFGWFLRDVGTSIGLFVIAAVLIAGGVAWLRFLKSVFHVVISSASGETNALSSKDRKYIEGVVASINQAIVNY